MHIALYKPDIPQNTAAIIRLSACFSFKVHIIEPCGFNLNDARFKKVVMDYIQFSNIYRYNDFDIFLNSGHLPKYVVVMTKSNVVHIVRCMVNSTGDANETNLK